MAFYQAILRLKPEDTTWKTAWKAKPIIQMYLSIVQAAVQTSFSNEHKTISSMKSFNCMSSSLFTL